MLTTRSPVLSSGSNHFIRSWLFGAVAPRIKLKEPQAEIRASEQNLSDFSRSVGSDADDLSVKKCRKTQQQKKQQRVPTRKQSSLSFIFQ